MFEAASADTGENRPPRPTRGRRKGGPTRRSVAAADELDELKARYKHLVKRLHPDVNGGDKDAEDRLEEINQAYASLKSHLAG